MVYATNFNLTVLLLVTVVPSEMLLLKYVNEHLNGSKAEQASLGITAGCDLDCGGFYSTNLAAAVKQGVKERTRRSVS